MLQWNVDAYSPASLMPLPGVSPLQPLSLCMQATSVGQAVAGFAVSVLSFITTWAALVPEPGQERSPADVAVTAFAYFTLSAAVIVASVAGYFLLQYLPFWLHHTSSHSSHGRLIMSLCLISASSCGIRPSYLWSGFCRHAQLPRTSTANALHKGDVLLAVKKDSEVIQEEGRAVDGRLADDGQGPSEEVGLWLALCAKS